MVVDAGESAVRAAIDRPPVRVWRSNEKPSRLRAVINSRTGVLVTSPGLLLFCSSDLAGATPVFHCSKGLLLAALSAPILALGDQNLRWGPERFFRGEEERHLAGVVVLLLAGLFGWIVRSGLRSRPCA
jgi:hypothetical protein